MQVHEPRAQLTQSGRRGQRVVYECTASALRGNFAPDNAVGGVAADALEDGLNGGGVFAGAHEVRTRSTAGEEVDRFDEHGLAGAGFAGEHGEPRREIDLKVIDHRKIANAEEAQHRRMVANLLTRLWVRG